MSTLPKTFVTPEKYLELDRAAERKSEYYDGEMFAMAGAGRAHNAIVWNLIAGIGGQLVGRPCQGFPSDARIRVSPNRRYSYPDLTVVCGKLEFVDGQLDILINPTLIVEVQSPSTERFDRGFKFDAYTEIASLREYVLVASDRASIEVFSRQADGRWLLDKAIGLESSIELASIDCRLSLADVYRNVEFAQGEASA